MKEQLLDYMVTNTGVLTLEDILLNFIAAVILSLVIFISYKVSHSGPIYSARFNISLAMLSLITTLVMNVIGNNIALSLGMVGALSIVRFRTAIKDPRDTAYIFWCIAVGICCGVSEYMIAGIGSCVIFIFLLIFGFVKSNDRYLIVIRGNSTIRNSVQVEIENQFKSRARLRVMNTTQESTELIYEVSRKMLVDAEKKSGPLLDILYKNEDITNVNLVCQNDEINR